MEGYMKFGLLILFILSSFSIMAEYNQNNYTRNNNVLWEITSDGEYIAEYMTLGNRGQNPVTLTGSFASIVNKYSSSYSTYTPSSIWSEVHTAPHYHSKILLESAAESEVYATSYQRSIPNSYYSDVLIRAYNKDGLKFEHVVSPNYFIETTDYNGLQVSDSGRIIAWVYDTYISKNILYIIEPVYNQNTIVNFQIVAQSEFDISGVVKLSSVSSDGSRLFVSSKHVSGVLDLSDLNQIQFLSPPIITFYVNDATISKDGSRIAWLSNSSKKVESASIDSQGNISPKQTIYTFRNNDSLSKLALDGEGERIAVGMTDVNDIAKAKVVAKNLLNNLNEPVRIMHGSGSISNSVTSLMYAQSGSILAVGLWGDEDNTIPQIYVYEEHELNPLLTHKVNGSVNKMEIFNDILTVAAKGVHAMVFGGGGTFTTIKIP